MVRYITLIVFAMVIIRPVFSQDVQWASKVIEFSSELSPKEYSSKQVLGKPNVLPEGGDSPNAWLPANPNKMEFIKVGFDRPAKIQQIAIGESYNPSATYQVFAYDTNDKEYLINTFTPKPIELKGRLLNIFFDRTTYDVAAIKLVLNGLAVPGYCGIDAIGISDTKVPVEVKVELVPNVTSGLKVEKLDENVNSAYPELRPLIAPDGKTLYFSRKNHPENVGGIEDNEDIWYSKLDEKTGEWEEAKNMGRPLNNAGENFISSITPDGKSMTIILGNKYQKNDDMNPGVSISSEKSDGTWAPPQPVDITNAFIENNDGSYFLAQNRKIMVIAVERFDSYGGKDLYVTFLQDDGKWTEPKNLGNDINTAHTEDSPYLAADDETLYFSSKGYSGFGGADIYISRRLDDTWQNWTEPENLGRDINSSEDDIFFNIPPSGKYAYFSQSNTELDADIVRIALPIFFQPAPVIAMKGRVYNSETLEPIQARIAYNLMPENTEVGFTISDSLTGDYQIVLPVGSSYHYTVSVDGFILKEDSLNLTAEKDFKEVEKDLYIDPLKMQQLLAMQALASQKGKAATADQDADKYVTVDGEKVEKVKNAIELNEGVLSIKVEFNFDSDTIRKNSYPDLNKIINLLNSTPVNVMIVGHTDNTGPDSYNQGLSERRAKSVFNYFVNKGVDSAKLETLGFGEKKPVATNATIEGRRRNRRVEFVRKDQFEEKYKK
jgi:outer membrane protein OmpA-like peptidoglycan-associated protein